MRAGTHKEVSVAVAEHQTRYVRTVVHRMGRGRQNASIDARAPSRTLSTCGTEDDFEFPEPPEAWLPGQLRSDRLGVTSGKLHAMQEKEDELSCDSGDRTASITCADVGGVGMLVVLKPEDELAHACEASRMGRFLRMDAVDLEMA